MNVKKIKIADLIQDQNNANLHTERGTYMVSRSLERLGAGRSILIDKDNEIIAGNLTTEQAADRGIEEVIVIETDGRQLVAVKRIDMDLDDPATGAREMAYADNRAAQISINFDADTIAADIAAGFDYSDWFQDYELMEMGIIDHSPNGQKSNARTLPLDVIYTLQGADCSCCLAVQAGWQYGIQSGAFRLCPYVGKLSGRHAVAFVDNDYQDYKHAKHLEVVSRFQPKYATVRDAMTEQQCLAAGIAYFELGQILDWAAELAEHAQNIIVVPKFDCIDQIPEQYVLGYSIPTSHGGTALPVEAFAGRSIHLLGGSWKEQLVYLRALGDQVVSLDNNYLAKVARFGQAIDAEGNTIDLPPDLNNVRYSALALSFGAVGFQVNRLFEE